MIKTSPQYDDYCSRLYTLGGLAFALKFFSFSDIILGGAKFTLQDKNVAIGSLTAVLAYILVAALICLLRDYQVDAHCREITPPDNSLPEFTPGSWGKENKSYMERYVHRYFFFQGTGFLLYAVMPLIFALFITVYNSHEILVFSKKLLHP